MTQAVCQELDIHSKPGSKAYLLSVEACILYQGLLMGPSVGNKMLLSGVHPLPACMFGTQKILNKLLPKRSVCLTMSALSIMQ